MLLACQLPQQLRSLSPPAATVITPAQPIQALQNNVPPTPTPALFAPKSLPVLAPVSALNLPTVPAGEIRYQRDLGQVVNPHHLPLLSETERERLLTQGEVFLAIDAPLSLDLIMQVETQEAPFFLSQSVVQAYQQTVLAAVWQGVTADFIEPSMLALAEHIVIASAEQWDEARHNGWLTRQQAAEKNWAYFTVVGRLLDPTFPTAAVVVQQVNDELDLLGLGGVYRSPYQEMVFDYALLASADSPLDQALLWYQHVPLSDYGDEQTLLLQGIWEDSETAVLWAQLAVLLGGEMWWQVETGTAVHIFSGMAPKNWGDVDQVGVVIPAVQPLVNPIWVESSELYLRSAEEVRRQLNLLASSQLLDDARAADVLKLEQTLNQLAVVSAKQTAGYRLSTAEQVWLAQATAGMVAALPVNQFEGKTAVILTLHEGEQTVFVGFELGE